MGRMSGRETGTADVSAEKCGQTCFQSPPGSCKKWRAAQKSVDKVVFSRRPLAAPVQAGVKNEKRRNSAAAPPKVRQRTESFLALLYDIQLCDKIKMKKSPFYIVSLFKDFEIRLQFDKKSEYVEFCRTILVETCVCCDL